MRAALLAPILPRVMEEGESKKAALILIKNSHFDRTLRYQNSRGNRMRNLAKISRSERHLCFSHYSNYQYFPLLFSISIPISISKFPKSSISISKSIFWNCNFQYQNQYQYVQNFDFSKFFKILCHVCSRLEIIKDPYEDSVLSKMIIYVQHPYSK